MIVAVLDGFGELTFEQRFPIPKISTPEEQIELLGMLGCHLNHAAAQKTEYDCGILLARIQARKNAEQNTASGAVEEDA